MINSITFREDNEKDTKVLEIANELHELDNRGSPTNNIRQLIEETGQAKIERLKAIKETEKIQEGEKR